MALDDQQVRKLMATDPEGALSALEATPLPSTAEFSALPPAMERKHLEISDLRVALYERCGRREEAAAERVAAMQLREVMLRGFEAQLAAKGKPLKPSDLRDLADRLEDAGGHREEAARCRLVAADLILAKYGDKAARARLIGAPWGGVTVTSTVGSLGTVRGLAAGLEFAEGFAAGYRAGTGEASSARDEQDWLVHEGRAIGLGFCKGCGAIVEAKISPSGTSGTCAAGHNVAEAGFVVMEDAPPGYYTDPYGRFTQRQWDGRAWTAHVRDGGTAAEDPPGDPIPTYHEQLVKFLAEHAHEGKPMKTQRMWKDAQKEWRDREREAEAAWRKRGRDVAKGEKKHWFRKGHP